MKKYTMAAAAISMMFACSGSVSAQSDLGELLGNLIEKSKNDTVHRQDNDKKGGLLEGLSNIFNKDKIASESDLVGKWKFSRPAVIFDSENTIQKIGGKMAAKRMEDRMNEILIKYGLTKNVMTIEFDNDKNFKQIYRRFKLSGTYSVENKNVTLKYAGKYKQLVGETQIDGNSLVIVMDIEKLNEYLVNIARMSPDPRAQMICNILAKFKDVKCGMRFEKQ